MSPYPIPALRASMAAFIAINIVVIAARIAIRLKLRCFGIDDYIIIVGFIGFLILCGFCFQAINAGFGLSDPLEIARFHHYDMTAGIKNFTIAQIVYIVSFPFVRLSVAFVLLRIAREGSLPRIRVMLVASVVVISVYGLACILMDAMQCIPLKAVWGGDADGNARCMSYQLRAGVGYAISALDIVSALFYSILPVFMLIHVKISAGTKFAIIFLLSLGAVTAVITIVRLHSLIRVSQAKDLILLQTLGLETILYSVLEVGISILTASLVALRPAIKYLPCGSHGRSSARSSATTTPYDTARQAHHHHHHHHAGHGGTGTPPHDQHDAWAMHDEESIREVYSGVAIKAWQ